MSVNYPFALYPGFPCSGYYDNSNYIKEVKRLHDYINKLIKDTTKEKCVVHITIGAPLEEYYSETKEKSTNKYHEWQWQQLLPYHLQALLGTNVKVYHIIIAPNKYFNPEEFKEPSFYGYWDFTKDKMKYTTDNYSCDIFYTMMPCAQLDQNIKAIERIKTIKNLNECYIKEYTQTENDVVFVNEFYSDLKKLHDQITSNSGVFTCYYYAVFREDSVKNIYKTYYFCPEIMDIFKKTMNSDNSLLAEWTYYEGCYFMKKFDSKYMNISYVAPDHNMKDYRTLVIEDFKLKLIKFKDFNLF
jgi:hypothetical protein